MTTHPLEPPQSYAAGVRNVIPGEAIRGPEMECGKRKPLIPEADTQPAGGPDEVVMKINLLRLAESFLDRDGHDVR